MTAPYMISGGVIFIEERTPITMERAETIRAVHLSNVSRWLERGDLSDTARLAMAKIEQELADEMAALIWKATHANDEAAETVSDNRRAAA